MDSACSRCKSTAIDSNIRNSIFSYKKTALFALRVVRKLGGEMAAQGPRGKKHASRPQFRSAIFLVTLDGLCQRGKTCTQAD